MESWFIPLNILMLIIILFAILVSLIFLLIIIFDKTCRTIPMLFIGNTCLAHFLFGINLLGKCIFTLYNDLKQSEYVDLFCYFRAYFCFATVSILNFSFVIQAFYRYVTVVYPSHLFWKSIRNQILLICFTWIFSFVQCIDIIFNNTIIYNVDNQICQVPVQPTLKAFHIAIGVYVIPNILIIIIYLKLLWHVHQMSKRVISANILSHAKRELTMVRRAVTLISILVILGFPFLIFLIMSIFTTIHKYHFRIAYAFIDVSLGLILIPLFQFTDPLKAAVMKRIHRSVNLIIPIVK